MDGSDEAARAKERARWPVRRFALGREDEDVSRSTTAAERIAMMWPLAVEAWTLAGRTLPEGPLVDLPSRTQPRRRRLRR